MSFLSSVVAPAAGFAIGGPAGAIGADQLFNGGGDTKAVTGAIGDAASGYMNIGQNTNQYGAPQNSVPWWGGDPSAAGGYYGLGLQGMNGANTAGAGYSGNANDAFTQALSGPGQASENQGLSDAFARSQGYDQAGSMMLDRQAAMGLAPSQAAYQMQAGLDQGLANQQAIAGGARGAAGLALAGTNMAANSANMQNQAYNQASQLRAAEMAQARGQYSGDTNNLVNQNLGRLNTGNGMSQFNAGQLTNYNLGMGGVGASYGNIGLGYGNLGQGYYQQAPYGYTQNQNAAVTTGGQNIGASQNTQDTNASIAAANTAAKAGQVNKVIDTVTGVATNGLQSGGK